MPNTHTAPNARRDKARAFLSKIEVREPVQSSQERRMRAVDITSEEMEAWAGWERKVWRRMCAREGAGEVGEEEAGMDRRRVRVLAVWRAMMGTKRRERKVLKGMSSGDLRMLVSACGRNVGDVVASVPVVVDSDLPPASAVCSPSFCHPSPPRPRRPSSLPRPSSAPGKGSFGNTKGNTNNPCIQSTFLRNPSVPTVPGVRYTVYSDNNSGKLSRTGAYRAHAPAPLDVDEDEDAG